MGDTHTQVIFALPKVKLSTASVCQPHKHTQMSMKGFKLSILTSWLTFKSTAVPNPWPLKVLKRKNVTCC